MSVYQKLFLVLLSTGGVLALCWLLRRVLLTPVRLGRNMRLRLHLRVSGAAPELENVVDSLSWLMADGVLPGRLILEDNGMDEETREIAELLVRDNSRISLWTKETNKIS